MKNAIVCLTRGYSNYKGYDSLIERNNAISKFIGSKYPIVIFHEGNIPDNHQKYIMESTPGLYYHFVDISNIWKGGYEGMCRFQAFDLWNVCSDYDYIMRIDEDCIITKCDYDPFSLIEDNVYLRSIYFDESHSETNATLPQRIQELTGADPAEFYNRKFVYTNVSVSSVQFWLEAKMNDLLKSISCSQAQQENRWGDLPVLGSLLNIFAVGKVGYIKGLSYRHLSHDNVIDCNGMD